MLKDAKTPGKWLPQWAIEVCAAPKYKVFSLSVISKSSILAILVLNGVWFQYSWLVLN